MNATIYAIRDSRSQIIRYVGCTRNLQARKNHYRATFSSRPIGVWLYWKNEMNDEPVFDVLDEVQRESGLKRESELIEVHRRTILNKIQFVEEQVSCGVPKSIVNLYLNVSADAARAHRRLGPPDWYDHEYGMTAWYAYDIVKAFPSLDVIHVPHIIYANFN